MPRNGRDDRHQGYCRRVCSFGSSFVEENVMNVVQENVLKAKSPVGTKQPYNTPVLSEYGDIRQITQNTTSPNNTTDSSGAPRKTT
jgi:hypothetical protein